MKFAAAPIVITLWFCLGPTVALGQESAFKIYAPSRSNNALLIVEAKGDENGLSLRATDKIDLGFAGATIVAHGELPLLYVAAPSGPDGNTPGAVVELNQDGEYLRHRPVSFAHGYSYLSLDRNNRFLLGACYRGGQVDVYELDAQGQPGKRVSSLDEGRVNAHCVLPSPDNQFVYIPYVKQTNALLQYRFDPQTGRLTALQPKNANPPEGTGPRHMAYHPRLPLVYFSNEQHLGVSVYRKETSGQLTLRQLCDAWEAGRSKKGVSSSDIVITADGRFLYTGIRGRQQGIDSIARYRIQGDGELQLLGLTPTDKIPWGLVLSPDGSHLLVSAFGGETLSAYRIGADGDLQRAATLQWPKQISDLVTGR